MERTRGILRGFDRIGFIPGSPSHAASTARSQAQAAVTATEDTSSTADASSTSATEGTSSVNDTPPAAEASVYEQSLLAEEDQVLSSAPRCSPPAMQGTLIEDDMQDEDDDVSDAERSPAVETSSGLEALDVLADGQDSAVAGSTLAHDHEADSPEDSASSASEPESEDDDYDEDEPRRTSPAGNHRRRPSPPTRTHGGPPPHSGARGHLPPAQSAAVTILSSGLNNTYRAFMDTAIRTQDSRWTAYRPMVAGIIGITYPDIFYLVRPGNRHTLPRNLLDWSTRSIRYMSRLFEATGGDQQRMFEYQRQAVETRTGSQDDALLTTDMFQAWLLAILDNGRRSALSEHRASEQDEEPGSEYQMTQPGGDNQVNDAQMSSPMDHQVLGTATVGNDTLMYDPPSPTAEGETIYEDAREQLEVQTPTHLPPEIQHRTPNPYHLIPPAPGRDVDMEEAPLTRTPPQQQQQQQQQQNRYHVPPFGSQAPFEFQNHLNHNPFGWQPPIGERFNNTSGHYTLNQTTIEEWDGDYTGGHRQTQYEETQGYEQGEKQYLYRDQT